MLTSRAARSVIAVAAIAICSSLALLAVAVAPEAKAETQSTGAHAVLARADRLLPEPSKGAACSERGWPHYEQHCLFVRTRTLREAGSVRVIATR